MFNAYWESLQFELPPRVDAQPLRWQRLVDTALPSPDDVCAPGGGPTVVGDRYHVQARSCVLLLAPLLRAGEAG
jgi:glycogen operon protein